MMFDWHYFLDDSINKFNINIIIFYQENLFGKNLLVPNKNDLNRKLLRKDKYEIEKGM